MLTAENIRKSFGDHRVLTGVDLSVSAGQVIGLMGVNGAGKTTLISILAGLERPDAGSVQVAGVDALRHHRAAASHLGIAPQTLGIYPTLTVRENLACFAGLAGLTGRTARTRVQDVAALMGLPEALNRPAGQLSGGQQRRLHTGMAILHRPEILFLDEPTVGSPPARCAIRRPFSPPRSPPSAATPRSCPMCRSLVRAWRLHTWRSRARTRSRTKGSAMSLLRSYSIARTSWQLQLRDPASSVIMTVLPLILIAVLIPSAKAQLVLSGYPNATGAEQTVPGLAVLYAFLSVEQVTTLFFREHAWGTWDRLRASPASTADIVIGKVVVRFLVQLAQTAIVFAVGGLLFGYRPNGSVPAIAIVVVVFTGMLVCFGVMLVALCRTMDQANTIGMLGGMVMAGLGGALAPVSSFPGWVQSVAPFTPAYWVLDALRRLTLEHATLADVAPATGIALAFAAGFALIAALCFRSSAVKIGTT